MLQDSGMKQTNLLTNKKQANGVQPGQLKMNRNTQEKR